MIAHSNLATGNSMMQEAAKSATSNKLLIRNIGLLLSGDLDHPILDADTVVAVDGVIRAVGEEKDIDAVGATTTIDARGTALAPGLIDSHVHPVFGDWTPRQNQLGWIDSCLHGGVTTMVSAGEVHTPGRPKDIVGLKAMAIFAQRAFHAFRPRREGLCGCSGPGARHGRRRFRLPPLAEIPG
jgi:enamidase